MRPTWNDYFQPASLGEALNLLHRHGRESRILAGGTDVIVELSRVVKPTNTLIDISRVHELRGIHVDDSSITIGALVTHNDVISSPEIVRDAFPLAQASLEIGAPQLRTRATVAGNIATGSPANDTISALIALDADVMLASVDGERVVPIRDFYPGFRQTALRPDELVRAIRIPRMSARERGVFVKLGLRRAQAISVLHFAIVLDLDGDHVRSARVALGCLAPTVVRGARIEEFLTGRRLTVDACGAAGAIVQDDVAPIDDLRGSGEYRRRALGRLFTDALKRLMLGEERSAWPASPILLDTTSATYALPSGPAGETLEATINGEVRAFPRSSSRQTLLNFLRDEAGLRGAKEGCAEGECGACTVWLE
ncbi:MAG TPA: FAD binding domain-containing protein, partial [Thermomicrobiales bacterium]|nr:FAD binding domain-containing protein [Thermomicrobiales bacterium]